MLGQARIMVDFNVVMLFDIILYTNMTGSFLVTSPGNMQVYFVAYDCVTTTFFAKPCPDFKGDTLIATSREILNKFKTKGYTPTFNEIDK